MKRQRAEGSIPVWVSFFCDLVFATWTEQVPIATGETTLTLMPIDHNPAQLSVEPWCFQSDQVTVVFEGRILKEKATDEQTMRDRLATAPWITLTTTLRPK